jgi:hypothetical protein
VKGSSGLGGPETDVGGASKHGVRQSPLLQNKRHRSAERTEKHMIKVVFPLVTAAIAVGLGSRISLGQGNLFPAGPPAPMMKTLEQIEPRKPISSLPHTIVIPGAYYITTNLFGSSTFNGITIAASDVTLDLGGFVMAGVTGSLDGILVSGVRSNIAVFNGTLRGWGSYGLNAQTAVNSQARHLRFSTNASKGVWIGTNGLITDCNAWANGSDGFVAHHGSTLTRCLAAGNGDDGFDLFSACVAEVCTASGNASNGIEADSANTIARCTTSNNRGVGILAGEGSLVRDCAVSGNSGSGIEVTTRCQVLQNSASHNGIGIRGTGERNRIDSNTSMANTNFGVRIDGASNLIVRNQSAATAQGNALNFSIADNFNIYGQIVGNGIGGNLQLTSGSGWENFTGWGIIVP